MGNMYFSEEDLAKMRARVTPVSRPPTEPATPPSVVDSEAVELTASLNREAGRYPETDGYPPDVWKGKNFQLKLPVEIVTKVPKVMVERDSLSDEWLAAELLRRTMPNWDPDTHHMQNTAARMVQSFREMGDRDSQQFTFTTFEAESDEMIVLAPIPFYTLCAHHVVPFHGFVYI